MICCEYLGAGFFNIIYEDYFHVDCYRGYDNIIMRHVLTHRCNQGGNLSLRTHFHIKNKFIIVHRF